MLEIENDELELLETELVEFVEPSNSKEQFKDRELSTALKLNSIGVEVKFVLFNGERIVIEGGVVSEMLLTENDDVSVLFAFP